MLPSVTVDVNAWEQISGIAGAPVTHWIVTVGSIAFWRPVVGCCVVCVCHERVVAEPKREAARADIGYTRRVVHENAGIMLL